MLHKTEIFSRQRLTITFGFRSYFFPLGHKTGLGWNVTDLYNESRLLIGLENFLSTLSFKEVLAFGVMEQASVYHSAKVKM